MVPGPALEESGATHNKVWATQAARARVGEGPPHLSSLHFFLHNTLGHRPLQFQNSTSCLVPLHTDTKHTHTDILTQTHTVVQTHMHILITHIHTQAHRYPHTHPHTREPGLLEAAVIFNGHNAGAEAEEVQVCGE